MTIIMAYVPWCLNGLGLIQRLPVFVEHSENAVLRQGEPYTDPESKHELIQICIVELFS